MAINTSKAWRGMLPWGAALAGGGLVLALLALGGSTRRPRREVDPDTGGHRPTDLALDTPHPGPRDRAPESFRPNMDAPIAAEERDAFAPATMPLAGGPTVD